MNAPIVYLCAFSIFLSLTLLLYNKGYKGANSFLAGYLFCSSAFLLSQYFFIEGKSISYIAFFLTGFPSLFFLIGPFAYFYVRSIFRDNVKLSKYDLLHFVLFLVIFSGTLPFIFSSWEYKCFISQKIIAGTFMDSNYNINFLIPKRINQLIRPPVALFYLILIAVKFFKNKNVYKSFSQGKIIKIWLGLFLLLFSLTFVFYIVAQLAYYLEMKFLFENLWFYYSINSIAFLYLAFNFSLVLFPQILYGLPISKLVREHQSNNLSAQLIQESMEVVPFINENKTTTENTFFSDEYQLEIEKPIHNWVVAKKYLEASASLISVSNFTNIPVHHLTYYFNVQLKVKYTDWRNTLRIEFAKKQIDAGFTKATTLEGLSLACGFSSQSTFIRAFKNSVACTPSDYIKMKQQ